jgi:hypothetical protein
MEGEIKVKVKFTLKKSQKSRQGIELDIYSSTSVRDGSEWSVPRPGRFTPKNVPVLVVQKFGRPQNWSGRVRKNCPTGIQSPSNPVPSDPLYRLRYLCSRKWRVLLYDVLCVLREWHRTVGAVIICFVSLCFIVLATTVLRTVVL